MFIRSALGHYWTTRRSLVSCFGWLLLTVGFCAVSCSASVQSIQLSVNGSTLVGGSNQTLSGTVTITKTAGDNGAYCPNFNSTPNISVSLVGSCGQTSTSISIKAPSVVTGAVVNNLTATIGSITSGTQQITVTPFVITISLSASRLVGASTQRINGTVNLNAPISSYGMGSLTVSGPLTIVSSSTLNTGGSSKSFVLSGNPVSAESQGAVTFTLGMSQSAIVTTVPLQIQTFQVSSAISSAEVGTALMALETGFQHSTGELGATIPQIS